MDTMSASNFDAYCERDRTLYHLTPEVQRIWDELETIETDAGIPLRYTEKHTRKICAAERFIHCPHISHHAAPMLVVC